MFSTPQECRKNIEGLSEVKQLRVWWECPNGGRRDASGRAIIKNIMKRTPFYKKARRKFPMADHPIKALESKAKKLVDEIFKYLPCPVCRVSLGLENKTTTPHHILPKSMYDHLRFIIHNLIPLCNEHHQWAHDNQKQFLSEFLPEFMPHHYKFYVKHRENHKPLRTTPGDLQLIIDDLEYYKQNQMAAENIIYEKG